MSDHQNTGGRSFVPPPAWTSSLPEAGRHDQQIRPLSKGFAIFLAFVAGIVGAHDSYLGYKKKGITKIVLFFLMIGGIINPMWAIVDIFHMLTNPNFCNAQGRLLTGKGADS